MKHTEKFERIFKERGLRSTPARRAILALLENAKQPLSVDELFSLLKKFRRKKIDLVTLYRNMKSFEAAGLVAGIDLGMGKVFYEYKGKHSHHHHHIVCKACSKIEHLEVCGLDTHIKMLEKMGYKKLQHKLEFSGLCSECA